MPERAEFRLLIIFAIFLTNNLVITQKKIISRNLETNVYSYFTLYFDFTRMSNIEGAILFNCINLPNGCNMQDFQIFKFDENNQIYSEISTDSSLIIINSVNEKVLYKYNINESSTKILVKLLIANSDLSSFFYYCEANSIILDENFNTFGVKKMLSMFKYSYQLTSLNLNNFDTSQVTDMSEMFNGCDSLISLNIENFDTSNVINMNNMFDNCKSLESLNISNFNTKNVKYLSNMFSSCQSLKYLFLDNFETNNVINMNQIFYYCTSLISLYIGNFDMSSVNDISSVNDFMKGVDNLQYCKYREFNENIFKSCSKSIIFNKCGKCENNNNDIDLYCNKIIQNKNYTFRYLNNETFINNYEERKCLWYLDADKNNYNYLYFGGSCDVIYKDECYSKCPINTCISQNNPNFKKCIDVEPYMKIINDECYLEDYKSIIKNMNNDIYQIQANNETIFSIISTSINIDSVIEKYSNITFVDLCECKFLLLKDNNLPSDTILYIIGNDSLNKVENFSINLFNYEIFLENGTKITKLDSCNNAKIKISSPINDLDKILFNDAVLFAEQGFDIYDRNNKFYNDYCAPASKSNNDITLKDRISDFYVNNVSLCNPGCHYNSTNLTTKRFICECIITNDEIEKREDISYKEYFLSFFNYKLVTCLTLIYDFNNLVFNIGFYIGTIITISCSINLTIFFIFGIRKLKYIIYDNIPSKQKLKAIIKEQKMKRKKSLKIEKSLVFEPSKKNKNKTKKIKPMSFHKLNNSFKKSDFSRNSQVEKRVDNINKIIGSVEILRAQNDLRKKKKKKRKTIIKNKENAIDTPHIKKVKKKKIKNRIKNKRGELKIDLEFKHLIIYNNSVEKDEINDVPYTQALRLDKRNIFSIFISMFKSEVDLLSIIFLRHKYSHLSIHIPIYLLELLIDLAFNFFLYSDDCVSEKYHNGGLEKTTVILVSLLSNTITSFLIYVISKLTTYYESLDLIINEVIVKLNYLRNTFVFIKRTKIFLGIFFAIQLILNILMSYYIIIFCVVYHNTQVSVMTNYFVGAVESSFLSLAYSMVFSSLRYLSLKIKSKYLYNTSKYLYNHL